MGKKLCAIAGSVILAMNAATVWADSGYFAVASIGDSSADLGAGMNLQLSDDDRSFEVGVGYAFNPNLSVQAGYHDFGQFDGELPCLVPVCVEPIAVQADISGWSLRVIGTYPFAEWFAVFASAGVLVWDADLSFALSDSGGVFTQFGNESDDLLYEAGLRWRLSSRWKVRASYEKANLDIESAKLGVLFRF